MDRFIAAVFLTGMALGGLVVLLVMYAEYTWTERKRRQK